MGAEDAVEQIYERKIKNGYMELPTGPGLGVTLNYDFLRRHATSMRAP